MLEFTMQLMWQHLTAQGLMADVQSEVLPVFGQVTPQVRPSGTAGPAARRGCTGVRHAECRGTTFAKAFPCLEELLGPRGDEVFLSICLHPSQWSRHLLGTSLHPQTAQQTSPRGSFSLGIQI